MQLLALTFFLALASAGCDESTPDQSTPVPSVPASSVPATSAPTASATAASTTDASTKNTITEAQILAIAPNSKSCDKAPAEGECATAKQAAEAIAKSFVTYKVTSKAEQAAIISLIALESGEFKYNINHYPAPGTPGQGSKYILYSQPEGKQAH